jgi:group II intron reverse transcriptase/maturase
MRQPRSEQGTLDLFGQGEAAPGTREPVNDTRRAQEDTSTEHLMEQILDPANIKAAVRKVKSNQGAPGIDGISVQALDAHLEQVWQGAQAQMMEGRYRPNPVRRVMIPKPGGGERMLGIPTVLDRVIQQAILQILSPIIDPTFSESSYGFRPGRSAHDAVKAAKRCIEDGLEWVVDIDVEKFFDRVNHDILMNRVAMRIRDKRVLRLIRAFLNSGIMVDGVKARSEKGTPQGGPLSPLLANILLDDLDKELESRGLRFARYADDCNIYVRSERAGERVMASIVSFLEVKLRLRVNSEKSAVARPAERRFPGFSTADMEGRASNLDPSWLCGEIQRPSP